MRLTYRQFLIVVKKNEPAFIIEVAKKLAEIKNIPLHEVAAVTSKNAEKVFGEW